MLSRAIVAYRNIEIDFSPLDVEMAVLVNMRTIASTIVSHHYKSTDDMEMKVHTMLL